MQKNSIFLCIYIEILYFIVIIIEEMNITQQSGGHKVAKVSFDNRIMFTYEAKSFPGVNKVAELVREDICLVTGFRAGEYVRGTRCKNLIIFGTVDKSDYLKELDKSGLIRLNDIRGKWETYSFQIVDDPYPDVDHALVIAGSDKRGTIYGLFHLSELLGVSPFVNWNHCYPRRRKNVVLTDECNMVSKEPSVRYRGFFINDEWPAFGNWATEHFGGINARCYEKIFELLLRLKGNYLWPAMWKSNFSMDGPGLESARLADEYGVVMSTSHHEPCMRSGEEYGILRGKDSIYGDAWDFISNKEGITRFWRDGLVRNKPFENVITLGMRGERDSRILDEDSGLKENIDLLRDVLRTQNSLIKEIVDKDLDKVPRQMVLFTEVEEFFYGDGNTKGLMGDPELEGVTLMLSDNNCGYTRTLPDESMRDHKGGYGMYYHLDMHGGPYSYQWIGGAYLPRIWEQMTQAYEYGVRQIWVVNVGDVGTQELGLSFFLDLAYDIDRWGGSDSQVTRDYIDIWTEKQFGAMMPLSGRNKARKIIWDYTQLLEKRRHEIMNAHVYHPLHFGEAQEVLDVSDEILKEAAALRKRIEDKDLSAFISLLYYPACGTANLMKMWILAGRNELFASQNRIEANELAKEVEECFREDERLIDEYESVDDGYYKGFGRSEHIGFVNWNDEDNKYPVRFLVHGANSPRMLLSRKDDEHYMTGLFWCDRPQTWKDLLRPDVNSIEFDLINGSEIPYRFMIRTDCKWMSFSKTEGEVKVRERITLTVDKALLTDETTGEFTVEAEDYSKARVTVMAAPYGKYGNCKKGVFVECDGYICMEAEHFADSFEVDGARFKVLKPYGRSGSAIKVYPVTSDFANAKKRPYTEYHFMIQEEGEYYICFMLAPTTPVTFKPEQYLGYSLNDGEICILNTVADPGRPFFLSPQWEKEAIENVKKVEDKVFCRKGVNILKFYGMSPGIVLERVVLVKRGVRLPESYLGPKESYMQGE
ncbi:alpha-glucuronidase Gh115A [Butyrivibrio proteoclasticus B316]|uniref:Alpha-glucuronidase Gh115A n=1 Tax=Butyrivibrio proteoclasticus (strain ATCC 51982 / DSM 14932 / B316) TaxID=515622 RepID=E0RW63_BUTPB|nr:alpha-glucuronidase Gh115A [Butyrivibrio proteoclasticus B316]